MAENKKSFILYCDQKGVWDKLDDAQAGRLIKHIIAYVNDENPSAPDFITELAFEPIKQSLKRDLKKWENQQAQRSEAGKRSAEVRKRNAKLAKRDSTTVNDRSISSTVNDNVSVNVSVNDIVNRENRFREQVAQHTQYSKETLEAFSDYWSESNPNGKKMKFEMQKTFDIARRLKTWNRNNFSKPKEEDNGFKFDRSMMNL